MGKLLEVVILMVIASVVVAFGFYTAPAELRTALLCAAAVAAVVSYFGVGILGIDYDGYEMVLVVALAAAAAIAAVLSVFVMGSFAVPFCLCAGVGCGALVLDQAVFAQRYPA